MQTHEKFVNAVRFSPDGARVLSVGSDRKGIFLDGKTGQQLSVWDLKDAHQSSIYMCAWSGDAKQILTCSADKTAKLWNAETLALEK